MSNYSYTIGNTGGVSSSQAKFVSAGYGQVEPNALASRKTGQLPSQLPAHADIEVLENGQFVKYNAAAGVVDYEGIGEWLLVLNEVKLYLERDSEADFAMKRSDYTSSVYNASGSLMPEGTVMTPRLYVTHLSDRITTNTIDAETLTLGDVLTPDPRSGLLVLTTDANSHTLNAGTVGEGDTVLAVVDNYTMKWQVIKVYTMPDGQPGAKIMRVQ